MYLLFERLSNDPPKHSLGELRAAVQEQVQRLLVSLVVCRSDDDPELLNMGIPSVAEMARGSIGQMEFWSLRLRELINQFEPRISLSSVAIEPTGNIYAPLKVAVEGELQLGDEVDHMHFDVELAQE